MLRNINVDTNRLPDDNNIKCIFQVLFPLFVFVFFPSVDMHHIGAA